MPQLEIYFGDVYKTTFDKRSINNLIVDVGNSTIAGRDCFQASRIMTNAEGKPFISMAGTEFPESIEQFTERWDLEKVVAAFRRGWSAYLGSDALEEVCQILIKDSQRASRIVSY